MVMDDARSGAPGNRAVSTNRKGVQRIDLGAAWRITQQGAGGTRCTKTRDCNKLFYCTVFINSTGF